MPLIVMPLPTLSSRGWSFQSLAGRESREGRQGRGHRLMPRAPGQTETMEGD